MVGGPNATIGRVEFCYNGQWGTVCNDQWSVEDAQVVCRQLGLLSTGTHRYSSGISSHHVDQLLRVGIPATKPHFLTLNVSGAVAITDATIVGGFGTATGPVLIDNVQCTGSETRLTNCYHNGVGTHNCFHTDDVGVWCQIREFISNCVLRTSSYIYIVCLYS